MIKTPNNENEFRQIAEIQKTELKETGFLSNCSIRFLILFYTWMSLDKNSFVSIYEENDGTVSGFVFCVGERKRYYKRFFYKKLFNLIFYPREIVNILISILKKKIKFIEYDAELTQIAVKSSFQGKGIASKLIEAAEKEFIKRGIFEYYLQVEENNINAVNLYKKFQFIIVDENKNDKIKKYLMKKILTNKII